MALKALADHLLADGPEGLGALGIQRIAADTVADVAALLELGDVAVLDTVRLRRDAVALAEVVDGA